MKRLLLTVGLVTLILARPARAWADVTGFLGFSPTTTTRSAEGFSFGVNMVIVGFEFEYAHLADKFDQGAPGLTTGMINVLLETPTPRTQIYLTAGAGFYHETYPTSGNTSLGTNIGGGVKLGLVGPLRLRLDYRVFTLHGTPLIHTPQRFYAGLNLSF